MSLHPLGWSETHWSDIQPTSKDHIFIRIIGRQKGLYRARGATGEYNCLLPGKFHHTMEGSEDFPVVGDWCIASPPFEDSSGPSVLIEKLLPRKSMISRGSNNSTSDLQIMAANVDFTFIVSSANEDFNINRMQRFVLLAKQGKTTPVLVLSKTDLAANQEELKQKLHDAFPDLDIVLTNHTDPSGTNELKEKISAGKTAVFIGSSGVGKSTLVNELLGEDIQNVQVIRDNDSKGRHTTTSGTLFFLPKEGMVIDTPGLRSIHVFGDDDNLDETFSQVKYFADQCKFRDCTHMQEPSCGVVKALASGELDQNTFDNYQKLQKEITYAQQKIDKKAAILTQKKRVKQAKDAKAIKKKIIRREN